MISARDCDFVEAHARGSYGDWLATWRLWLLACNNVMVVMRVLSPPTMITKLSMMPGVRKYSLVDIKSLLPLAPHTIIAHSHDVAFDGPWFNIQ